jgi:hypothetical protein
VPNYTALPAAWHFERTYHLQFATGTVSMRRAPKASPPINVRVTKHGKEYEGEYSTTLGLVTVHYRSRQKSTQPGASTASTARMLLRELVDEEEAGPSLGKGRNNGYGHA